MAQTTIPESSAVLNANKPIDANAPVGPVLQMVNGVPMVSSHDVAGHFGKRHADLLRSIKAVSRNSPEGWAERNFAFSEYEDSTGRKLPQADLTRDGFVVVAMGFTGKKAITWKITYVQAFNAMEAELARQQVPATTGTLTPTQQQELKELVQAKASAYPDAVKPKVFSQIWMRLQRKFKVPRYSELPVAVFGEARDYVIAMQVRSVDAPALEGSEPKALPLVPKSSTLQDYASIFRALPQVKTGFWRDLSHRNLLAHDRFRHEMEGIKEDALRPFKENRRIEVATFMDFATLEVYKRLFDIAEEGEHTAYMGVYGALLGLESLHDMLLRG